MALRAAVKAAVAPGGLTRLFATSPFNFTPPPSTNKAPEADPSSNLFVSGLSKRTTTEGLREAFSKFGEVVQAKVVTDRVSGYSKGFGFVKYATTEEATAAKEGMHAEFLDGWVIFAEYAKPRPAPGTQQQFGNPPYGSNGQR